MEKYVAEPVSELRAEHAEGPAWDARLGELLWVDQFAGLVHRGSLDSATGRLRVVRSYSIGSATGAVVPVAGADTGWLVAAGAGFAHLAPDGTVAVLAEPEHDVRDRNRMNDGKCDPLGRFYAGSMAWDKRPGAGSLYRFEAERRVVPMLRDVTISNGMAWSGAGDLMYYIDTPTQRVDVFDVDPGGEPVARRTAFTIAAGDGAPDGMCIDHEGCLWVALWGRGQVRRYTPDGVNVAIVEVAAPLASSCAFGGADGRVLFITTSQEGYTERDSARHPEAGRVFAVRLPVGGPPAAPYRP